MINESERSVNFPVMRITQPIGEFFVGKMAAKDLIDIAWFDIRRLKGGSDLDEYMGIQRKISDERVKEIAQYVTLTDATFPTAVILAVEGRCATLSPILQGTSSSEFFNMTLKNSPGELDDENTLLFRGIARVLDGQHRIKGLKESLHDLSDFEVNVCIFVDPDIADQASIFATVNLAQTKVNRSLVYDLLSYSKSRSPERTCHTVTVTLDQSEKSPFYCRVKRLGVSTEGRFGEVLTQATVVRALLPYLTSDVLRDRDIGKRSMNWASAGSYDSEKLIFRHWFIKEHDDKIATQMMHYFEAVRRRWPKAWEEMETGNMLPRTNGFRAFMSFLRPAYNHLKSDEFVKMSSFLSILEKINLDDKDFNTKRFLPGSAGERKLFHTLMEESGLDGYY
jgi:DGQHR domain-containing protein